MAYQQRLDRARQTNILDLRGLRLTEILTIFPPNITEINCSGNRLRTLPYLPPNLRRLICSNNALICLPELPQSLTLLDCSKNYLTELPEVEHTSLTHLICSENMLQTIPALPLKLRCLSCHTNTLEYLPEMPKTLILLWSQFNPTLHEPFRTISEETDPVLALQNYYDHKRYVREASKNLLNLRHVFDNNNKACNAIALSEDILNAIGSHFSGINSPIDKQIACLKH